MPLATGRAMPSQHNKHIASNNIQHIKHTHKHSQHTQVYTMQHTPSQSTVCFQIYHTQLPTLRHNEAAAPNTQYPMNYRHLGQRKNKHVVKSIDSPPRPLSIDWTTKLMTNKYFQVTGLKRGLHTERSGPFLVIINKMSELIAISLKIN